MAHIQRYYKRHGTDELIRAAAAIAARRETAVVPVQEGRHTTYYAFHRGIQVDTYGSERAALRRLALRRVLHEAIGDWLGARYETACLRGWLGERRRREARHARYGELLRREVGQ